MPVAGAVGLTVVTPRSSLRLLRLRSLNVNFCCVVVSTRSPRAIPSLESWMPLRLGAERLSLATAKRRPLHHRSTPSTLTLWKPPHLNGVPLGYPNSHRQVYGRGSFGDPAIASAQLVFSNTQRAYTPMLISSRFRLFDRGSTLSGWRCVRPFEDGWQLCA
jgi:hypothetical protein